MSFVDLVGLTSNFKQQYLLVGNCYEDRCFFYKHNVYRHMKAQIQFKVFCSLMNELVLEKK